MDDTADTAWKQSFNHPLLSYAEEQATFAAMQEATGDEWQRLAHHIMRHNQRLVFEIAARYKGPYLTLQDLTQQGNFGLWRAIELFDHTRGYKFSTYATAWIRQACSRAVMTQRGLIRVPVHMGQNIGRINRIEAEYKAAGKPVPSDRELAALIGVPLSQIKHARQAAGIRESSLNTPTPDGGAEFGDLLPSDYDLEAEAEENELCRLMDAVLGDALTPRERRVVKLHFGLNGGMPQGYQEIGERLGISRERVRQVMLEALAVLQSSPELAAWLGVKPAPPITRAQARRREGKQYSMMRENTYRRIMLTRARLREGAPCSEIAVELALEYGTAKELARAARAPQEALERYRQGKLDLHQLKRLGEKAMREERAA